MPSNHVRYFYIFDKSKIHNPLAICMYRVMYQNERVCRLRHAMDRRHMNETGLLSSPRTMHAFLKLGLGDLAETSR
jgi:hypothetical protein